MLLLPAQARAALQVALQILNAKFQPTQVQDVTTIANIPVVGALRVDITDTLVLSLSMDETSSGALWLNAFNTQHQSARGQAHSGKPSCCRSNLTACLCSRQGSC